MSTLAAGLSRIGNALFACACAVVIVLGGLQLWDRFGPRSGQQPPPIEPVQAMERVIPLDGVTVKTVGTPRIILAEFSDYECPFCGQYARGTFARVQKDFVDTGRLSYVFVNNPIERLHARAFAAAEAAECAGLQGKMWEMHDALFGRQSAMSRKDFADNAAALNLDLASFDKCLDGATAARVRAQMEVGKSLGVTGTPTFFIGYIGPSGEMKTMYRLLGSLSFEMFAKTLDKAYREVAVLNSTR